MSTLKQQIETRIVEAVKTGQSDVIFVLRDIKSQIVNSEKNNKNQELDEVQTLAVVEKMANCRIQSIDSFNSGNRPELAKKELFELLIIQSYLPTKFEKKEVEEIVYKIISENNYTKTNDMSQIIKKFNEAYPGKSDGKTISKICKEVLV